MVNLAKKANVLQSGHYLRSFSGMLNTPRGVESMQNGLRKWTQERGRNPKLDGPNFETQQLLKL